MVQCRSKSSTIIAVTQDPRWENGENCLGGWNVMKLCLMLMYFKILTYEMFWVRQGKLQLHSTLDLCFFVQLSDVARSFKAGLHLVVQPQCMCYLAMSNLILTTKTKQGFEVENFPAFWADIDLLGLFHGCLDPCFWTQVDVQWPLAAAIPIHSWHRRLYGC